MKPIKFYKSLFAILRIDTSLQQNNAKIVGTGFVINTNPIYILTCNHVVSEGKEDNNGNIVYSIAKRSDNITGFDLRNFQISYLKAKKIFYKPEYDLAILEIDPSINKKVAQKLGIPNNIKSLNVDFNVNAGTIGSLVEWISAGTLGDPTITPRFFKGNIIARYIKDQTYKFINPQKTEQLQAMKGIRFLEIDQLFFPGCSGSPIISSKNKKVIGWVHGFNSWPVPTTNLIDYKAEIINNNDRKNVTIKSNSILTASLSLAIDIKNVKNFLIENRFIKKNNFLSLIK